MPSVRFPLTVVLLLTVSSVAYSQSVKPKAKGKPAPKLSAEQLEAKASKCLTAKEAFDLYNSEMPNMVESEREMAQFRRRYWGAQAQNGARRFREKWLTAKEAQDLDAQAAPLAAEAARTFETSVPAAVALLERALSIHPEHLPSLFVMGSVHGSTKNYATAEKYFERCVEIDPSHFASVYNLAVCEELVKDFESSLNRLQVCAKLNREHPSLASTLAKFKQDLENSYPAAKRTRKQTLLVEETERLVASIPAVPLPASAPKQLQPPDLIKISESDVLSESADKKLAPVK